MTGRIPALVLWLQFACMGLAPVAAAGEPPVLPPRLQEQVTAALRQLNLSETDPGFEKDVAKPSLVLQRLRNLLHEPLALSGLADECLTVSGTNAVLTQWQQAAAWLEVTVPPDPPPLSATGVAPDARSTAWEPPVRAFINEVEAASVRLSEAYAGLTTPDRRLLAANLLEEVFLVEDDPATRTAVEAAGIPAALLDRLTREHDALDPAPAVSNLLALIADIDLNAVAHAAQQVEVALTRLRTELDGVRAWPATPTPIVTALGRVVIGTRGDDHYTEEAVLIVEPGGNDRYGGAAACVNGLTGGAIAIVLDLQGNDTYDGNAVVGPGGALFGLVMLLDCAGNDTYRTAYSGLASGLYGAALLQDEAGDDTYQSLALAQGAGYAGIGILRDHDGDDRYDLGYSGQAYAGVRGVGLLLEDAGNDIYSAGGKQPDYERHPEHYLSLAQGFAIGLRPFAGGGIAALVDRSGNDTYLADVYGQGVSYWYSAGLLIDEAGHDSYRLYEYGQGSGIHLSLGLLSDRAGNDHYTGYSLVQGNAHDYAVGMLLDHAGNDTYTSDHYSQGLAINNAFGMLLDAGGNDGYFALKPASCQGIGNDGATREYGSLALLLDLAGQDFYASGASDGARAVRPNHGIIYDVKE